jgi:DNA-binding transcriptional LysR family regulator
MEMHQVRYFLAAVTELNFTKAADRCNVSQPSLTRAVKQLEDELGGDLFRRERPHAQLTELGLRMLPLLKQCYESAMGARSLASAIKGGEMGVLRLALSHTVGMDLVVAHLAELKKHFNGLEMKLLRGTVAEIVELMKKGEAELAIAGEIREEWDRLDRWPLFTEPFQLVVNGEHELANELAINIEKLRQQPFLHFACSESAAETTSLFRHFDIDLDRGYDVNSGQDLLTLIEANLGVAMAPRSMRSPDSLKRVVVEGVELSRTVYLYGVAGRQRTAVASAMHKMLRARDWSAYADD